MSVFERLILFEQTYNREQMEKRSGNKTQLTPYRKGWREELKDKHGYRSSRRKRGLLKKAGEWQ